MDWLLPFAKNERILHTITYNFRIYESLSSGKHSLTDYFFLTCSNCPYFMFLAIVLHLILQVNLGPWNKIRCKVNLELVALLYFFIANHALSILYKISCRQMRPSRSTRYDYGMPSSHAMFVGFMTFYLPFIYHKFNKKIDYGITALIVVLLLLIAYSRIHLGHHTIGQLAVGFVVGLVHAVIASSIRTDCITFLEKCLIRRWKFYLTTDGE